MSLDEISLIFLMDGYLIFFLISEKRDSIVILIVSEILI